MIKLNSAPAKTFLGLQLGLRILGIAATTCLAAACHSNSAVGANPDDQKFYTKSPAETTSQQVSSDLGIPVEISDSKDFTNEFQYNRVLGLLERNKVIILPLTPSILKIYIGDSTIAQKDGEKYVIGLSFEIDELTLQRFFQQSFADQIQDQKFTEELASKLRVQVDDSIGLRGGDLQTATSKLTTVGEQVEFNQDQTFSKLTLGEINAITSNGAIIDMSANPDDMVVQLQQMISARIQWRVEMLPFLSSMNLRLSYQYGTFSGTELEKAISYIKTNAAVIQSHLHRFSSVVVGKRWDLDYNRGVMLIDYQASADDLLAHLIAANPAPSSSDFSSAKQNLSQAFISLQSPMNSIEIENVLTQSDYDNLLTFTSQVVPRLDAAALQKLGIQSLHLGKSSIPTSVSLANHELIVGLPTSAESVNSVIDRALLQSEWIPRKLQLQQNCANLGIKMDLTVIAPSESDMANLDGINAWLSGGGLTRADVKTLNLQSLQLINTDPASGPTRVENGNLILNFQDFQAQNMRQILTIAGTPSPAP